MGDLILNVANGGVPILAYLLTSLAMFFIGIYGFLTRRNLILILISVELILNSASLNFAIFNRYLFPNQMEGMFFTIFIIAIAACETAVAIAIIINIYRKFRSSDVDNLTTLNDNLIEK